MSRDGSDGGSAGVRSDSRSRLKPLLLVLLVAVLVLVLVLVLLVLVLGLLGLLLHKHGVVRCPQPLCAASIGGRRRSHSVGCRAARV